MLQIYFLNPVGGCATSSSNPHPNTLALTGSLVQHTSTSVMYFLTVCKHLFRCPDEQKRLQLYPEPPLYPMITIKAPVPWKCSIQVAKNRLEQILMVNHPVIRAVNMLWHNLYNNLIIVDSASFYTGDVPFHAETITEMIHKSCKITRDVRDWKLITQPPLLNHPYLPYLCAPLLLKSGSSVPGWSFS